MSYDTRRGTTFGRSGAGGTTGATAPAFAVTALDSGGDTTSSASHQTANNVTSDATKVQFIDIAAGASANASGATAPAVAWTGGGAWTLVSRSEIGDPGGNSATRWLYSYAYFGATKTDKVTVTFAGTVDNWFRYTLYEVAGLNTTSGLTTVLGRSCHNAQSLVTNANALVCFQERHSSPTNPCLARWHFGAMTGATLKAGWTSCGSNLTASTGAIQSAYIAAEETSGAGSAPSCLSNLTAHSMALTTELILAGNSPPTTGLVLDPVRAGGGNFGTTANSYSFSGTKTGITGGIFYELIGNRSSAGNLRTPATISGGGLTWDASPVSVVVSFNTIASATFRLSAWRGTGTTDGTNIVVGFGGVNQTACSTVLVQIPDGTGTSPQTPVTNRADSGTAVAATMAAFADAKNGTLLFALASGDANTANDALTGVSGGVALWMTDNVYPSASWTMGRFVVGYARSNISAPGMTWADSLTNACLALEVSSP